MVVTSGRSQRHVASVADHVIEDLSKPAARARRRHAAGRLGADRRRRRDRPRLPAGSARLLQSRKDVVGRAAATNAGRADKLRRRCVIIVAAVGRLKQAPNPNLCERYRKRAAQAGRALGLARRRNRRDPRKPRATTPSKRMIEESIALANLIPSDGAAVLLDRARRKSRQRWSGRAAWQNGGRQTAPPRVHDRRTRRPCRRRSRTKPICGSPSAPRPGRTSLCASCCWSSFTGRRRSFQGIRITGRRLVLLAQSRIWA